MFKKLFHNKFEEIATQKINSQIKITSHIFKIAKQ